MVRNGLMGVDEGEAWGVHETLKWALQMGFSSVVVETDAQRIRDAVNRPEELDDTIFGDLIAASKVILRQNSGFEVRWVSRNANSVAHALARNSRDFESPSCWVEPPSFVVGLLDVCHSCE